MLTLSGIVVAALALLSACASAASSGAAPAASGPPFGELWPRPPRTDVVGTGTVIDQGGDAQLCLGAVMESFPPQCAGVPVAGWTWDGLDGAESSGDVTWGAYAVRGSYDGASITVTEVPVLLALYDPMRPDDPTGGEAGTTDAAELDAVQATVADRLGADLLGSHVDRGYVWAQVVWDDGTLQASATEEFGEGVVIVESALREVGG